MSDIVLIIVISVIALALVIGLIVGLVKASPKQRRGLRNTCSQ